MVKSIDAFPLSGRLANGFVSYANYILKMIWPTIWQFSIHTRNIPLWQVAGAGLVGRAYLLRVDSSCKEISLSCGGMVLVYFGTLVPGNPAGQVGLQGYGDRYTYVPFIGLFI